jgi:hypothetical protein
VNRRTVTLGVIVVLALLLVGILLRSCSDSGDETTNETLITTTTFPEPPSGAGSISEESEGTLTKTAFTTTDAPGAVLDSYLSNFARIGWTTLSDERAGDAATLTLQGGNRYAAVRAVNSDGTTTAIVCTGVEKDAVLGCASVAASADDGS